MKKVKSVVALILSLLLSVCTLSLMISCNGDKEKEDKNLLAQPTNFTFNEETGEFSFDGVENAGYYYVRIFGYNEVQDVDDNIYISTSTRLSGGAGKKSGTVDVSSLVCGAYRVKCQVFAPSGTDYVAPDPVMKVIYKQQGVKLITPQFKLTSEGNKLTINADEYVFASYIKYQQFPCLKYIIKDANGNVVQEIAHLKSDLIYDLNLTTMMNLYAFTDSATKSVILTPGTYTVQAIATTPTKDSKYISDADASEVVSITLTATGTAEAKTSKFDEPTAASFGTGGVIGSSYAKENPEILAYTGMSLSIGDGIKQDAFNAPETFEVPVSTEYFGKMTATKGTPGEGETLRYTIANENGKATGSIVFKDEEVTVSIEIDAKSYFAHYSADKITASGTYKFTQNEDGTYKIEAKQQQGGWPGGGGPGGWGGGW